MISTRIDTLLAARNMTRADLARRTGIPYHRLNMWWARARAKPSGPDIEAVGRELGVSISFLLYGGDPDPASDRDWISRQYANMDPEQKKLLEAYAKFLLAQSEESQRKKTDE